MDYPRPKCIHCPNELGVTLTIAEDLQSIDFRCPCCGTHTLYRDERTGHIENSAERMKRLEQHFICKECGSQGVYFEESQHWHKREGRLCDGCRLEKERENTRRQGEKRTQERRLRGARGNNSSWRIGTRQSAEGRE